ncbi:MAG: methyltransferase domain-containing protein [Actinomycetia bacterium]|nr:methyltransferase domain-containing protein [Actinomycetes bacterium]
MVDDRTRWNERYGGGDDSDEVPAAVSHLLPLLPGAGRALDVAGGRGTTSVALAGHGLDVTLIDVSDTALALAGARAARRGVGLTVVRRDLRAAGLPDGVWDVICCFRYLDRDLLPQLVEALTPGGLLAVAIATRTNLERHHRPSPDHLLDDGELVAFAESHPDLEVISCTEAWNADDRHMAELFARRI